MAWLLSFRIGHWYSECDSKSIYRADGTMSTRRNEFLDAGFSDSSDNEAGYDSEAAEISRTRTKRRKLSPSTTENTKQPVISDNEQEEQEQIDQRPSPLHSNLVISKPHPLNSNTPLPPEKKAHLNTSITKATKPSKPGVIYLSSLPPYLKPSALRNLLQQRGFTPITRLFLAPSTKSKTHSSKKSSKRQLYTEGWIEFASKKTAKRCAETLNATTVGGRKGGFYHDDIWNMKYLRGVGWDDLMGQVREERREEEVRRMEERGQIARETREFIEGVERGKMARGMERSREKKRRRKIGEVDGGDGLDGSSEKTTTWRQYKVKEGSSGRQKGGDDSALAVSDDVKRILSKIF